MDEDNVTQDDPTLEPTGPVTDTETDDATPDDTTTDNKSPCHAGRSGP